MCAAGSHEITREPSGKWMISSTDLTAVMRLWCVSCTPFGVGDDVLDLVGRVGLVDRERRGADGDRRDVHEMELGAVGEHDRDALAALEAELDQTTCHRVAALLQLPPGPRDLVVHRADG